MAGAATNIGTIGSPQKGHSVLIDMHQSCQILPYNGGKCNGGK